MTGPAVPEVTRERVGIATGSLVRGVLLTTLAFIVFSGLSRASGVFEWVLAAVLLAGLVEPVVGWLGRSIRRGLAVLLVFLLAVAATGLAVYGVADGIRRGSDALRATVEDEAVSLEARDDRIGELAREAELSTRARRLVDQLPLLLFGHETTQGAVRGAVERVVSLLVVTVLTIFLLLRGPDIARAFERVPIEPGRRQALARAATAARRRGLGHLRRTLLLSAGSGLAAYGLAQAVGVPGAAALGVWAGLWDLLPVIGGVIGFLPLVGLALAESVGDGVVVLVGFMVVEIAQLVARHRWVHTPTMRLGPFVTSIGLIAGMELAGVFGAIAGLGVVAFGVAFAEDAVPAWRAATDADAGGAEAGGVEG